MLVESPCMVRPGLPVSSENMRCFISKVADEGGGEIMVCVWRSYAGLDADLRVCAPAWRWKNGREMFSVRAA